MTSEAEASFALGVEYDGSAFHGFQRQANAASVQASLEQALSSVANEPITLVAAGRTDAGVHATQQVVSFRTSAPREPEQFLRGVNSLTPRTVTIHWCRQLPFRFHARFDAVARRYLYLFYLAPHMPAINRTQVSWLRGELDDAAMHRAAQALVGEHDFSSFRGAACQASSPIRRIHRIEVARRDRLIGIDVTANAFLLHMVRNLAGALAVVGGNGNAEWLAELLTRRDRKVAPATAPPQGLYLIDVDYPNLDIEARLPLIW